MNTVDYVAWLLIVVGALNWGVIGAFRYDLVFKIFGGNVLVLRSIYVLVGLAAIYSLASVVYKMTQSSSKK